jgi:hypothetical protein
LDQGAARPEPRRILTMRFTNYTRFSGNLADALNLQGLLDHLSDFLLQAASRAGRTSIRTGASSTTRTARSTRSRKRCSAR